MPANSEKPIGDKIENPICSYNEGKFSSKASCMGATKAQSPMGK